MLGSEQKQLVILCANRQRAPIRSVITLVYIDPNEPAAPAMLSDYDGTKAKKGEPRIPAFTHIGLTVRTATAGPAVFKALAKLPSLPVVADCAAHRLTRSGVERWHISHIEPEQAQG